jgi:hypothetical protein
MRLQLVDAAPVRANPTGTDFASSGWRVFLAQSRKCGRASVNRWRPRRVYSSTTAIIVGMSSNLNLTCKAVLFDMDGTLVDSAGIVERAWSWWPHGIERAVSSRSAVSHFWLKCLVQQH